MLVSAARLLVSHRSLQAVKNLVFIGKLLYKTSTQLHQQSLSDDSSCGGPARSELDWLISEMGWLARQEAGHHPKETMKRTCVFQWTAAVAIAMGEQGLGEWVSKMLPPLYKELSAACDVTSKTAGKRQLVWVICLVSRPALVEGLGTRLDLAGDICCCRSCEPAPFSRGGC